MEKSTCYYKKKTIRRQFSIVCTLIDNEIDFKNAKNFAVKPLSYARGSTT